MKLSIRSLIIQGLIFFNFSLFSCKKDKSFAKNSFEEAFEAVFYKLRFNNMFLPQEKSNLDSLYLLYCSKFKSLSTDKPDDVLKAYGYFEKITQDICDGHFQLEFLIAPVKGRIIHPAFSRKLKNGQEPVDFFNGSSKYLNSLILDTVVFDNNVLPFKIKIGELNNKKLYIAFNKLVFSSSRVNDNRFYRIENLIISALNDTKYDCVVFDLRGNIGGRVEDIGYFLGFFTDQKIKIGYNVYKIGYEKFSYSEDIDCYIYPKLEFYSKVNKQKKIYVLINAFTISSAELLAVGFKALQNEVCLIGESTFGAMGIVSNSDVFNAGPLQVNNMLKIYSTSVVFKDINRVLYENYGYPPDKEIFYKKGVDEVLEFAKNYK